MYLKVHEIQGKRIVAVCNKELIGRVLERGAFCIDLKRYGSFYKGRICNKAEVARQLKEFSSANLVGKNAVNVALNMGLATKKEVKYINRIPYIQIYKV